MAKKPTTPDIIREHTRKTSGFDEFEEHESFGTVQVSRCSGNVDLFDVSSPQQHFISLRINEAQLYRSLSNDRVHSRKELVEVYMSETQFARLLSSIGMGGGVPCTIHRVASDDKNWRDSPPEDNKGEKLKQDLKVHTDYVSDLLKEMDKKLTELTQAKRISKGQINEVQQLMYQARMTVDDNLPFVLTQATEQLEGAIEEARANIDAYQKHQAMKLGLGVIADTVQQLKDGDDE
jgi:hypothetical protein